MKRVYIRAKCFKAPPFRLRTHNRTGGHNWPARFSSQLQRRPAVAGPRRPVARQLISLGGSLIRDTRYALTPRPSRRHRVFEVSANLPTDEIFILEIVGEVTGLSFTVDLLEAVNYVNALTSEVAIMDT